MRQVYAKAKKWWLRHIGRRGSALLFFSFLNSYYCYGLLTLPTAAYQTPAFKFIDGIVPIEVWAGAWGLTGLLCLIFAFRRWDGIAFTGAIAVYLLWGIVYVAGDIAGEIYRGSINASLFFALVLFVLLISGWPEYPGGDQWETQESSSRSSP